MTLSRREFNQKALWAVLVAGGIERISFAATAVANKAGIFTKKQWQTIGLVMDEILPATETSPSATAAGVLDFLENGFKDGFWRFRAFPKTLSADKASYRVFILYYRKLIARVDQLAKENFKKDFSSISATERETVMQKLAQGLGSDVGYRVVGITPINKISDAELFELAKRHCVQSYFAEPAHGGNKDYGGWKAVGHICHANYPDKPETCPSHYAEEI